MSRCEIEKISRFDESLVLGSYLGLPIFVLMAEKCDTWLRKSSAMGWSIWKIRGRGIERPLYADTWSQS